MGKQKYAPTRSMRRQKNNPSKVEADKTALADDVLDEPTTQNGDGKPARKKLSTAEKIFLSASIVAIISLVLATIFIWTREPLLDIDNPVAVIELDNGMVLEFELYADYAPTAVSNFIYLANNKLYDKSAVHKIENNQLFAGYYRTFEASTSTSNNVSIYAQFKNKDDLKNKIRYAVRKRDDSPYKPYNLGYLSTVQSSDTSDYYADFRICLDNVDNLAGVYGTVFGYARGEKTLQNLEALNKLPVFESINHAPREGLSIKTVKIKANDKKWKDYDFFSDHTSEDYSIVAI